jgi:hypothetical protein
MVQHGVVDHFQDDGNGRIDELTLGPIEQKRNAFDLFPNRGIKFHAERFDRCHKKISMFAEEGWRGRAAAHASLLLARSHPSAWGGPAGCLFPAGAARRAGTD